MQTLPLTRIRFVVHLFPLGRHGRKWEYNIKMELQEIGCDGMDWIDLAEDRDRLRALVMAAINLRVPYSLGNILIS